LFVALGARVASAQTTATLNWEPSPTDGVSGYRIYFGAESGFYTNSIDAGDVTALAIPGLEAGVTYYFVVSAYDANGQESEFSNEVSYTPAGISLAPLCQLQLQMAGGGQMLLTVTGQPGRTYDLLASPDLSNWTVIARVTADTGGTLGFTDPDAPKYPARFYRAMETQPGVQLRVTPDRQAIVTVIGQNNHTYNLQASPNLQDWTVIGTVTLGTGGQVDFSDPEGADDPARFYRTQEVQL
jgi:hypothetical protein